MSDDTRIDDVDFVILRCLQKHDSPLWKNKIHECQSELLNERVSVQTIGRRVDRLQNEGLLESCIISPDEIKRDLIIAFKLTEDGTAAIQDKRREVLLEAVKDDVFADDTERDLGDEALTELICDEFQLTEDGRELLGRYDREEQLSLIVLYYTWQKVEDVFAEQDSEKFVQLAEQNEEIADVLNGEMIRLPE